MSKPKEWFIKVTNPSRGLNKGLYGPFPGKTKEAAIDLFAKGIGYCNPDSLYEREKNLELEVEVLKNSSTLEDLLETWSVLPPGQWENNAGPKEWFAVCNDQGIVAYFGNEQDALRFRLSEINRTLNG